MVSCSSASNNRVTVYPRERELIDDHMEAYWGEEGNAEMSHSLIISKRFPVFADDEDVTCNVCDRAFCTPRMLDRHKQKKRHWG